MTVRIGEMTSQVETMPEGAARAAAPDARSGELWQELERLRSIRAALMDRERRTRCEGFDD